MPRLALRTSMLAVALVLAASASFSTTATDEVEAAGITLQQLDDGLSQPLGIVHAGDGSGRLFIVEKGGLIRIFDGTNVLGTPFLDVSGLITNPREFEQGLLGLAFHPDYEDNGFFYINYTDALGDTVVSRWEVSGNPNVADATSEETILTQDQPLANHNGGQLQFGPDGYLYIGMGDGGGMGDPGNNGQNVNTLLGKILRIDVDAAFPYAAPADNPLVGAAGLDEIWAYGLRNPWRFSFDRLTGDLFIADVGQETYEEVNFQAAGDTTLRNYGWRVMEGAHCFSPPSGCDTSGKTPPIFEYDHGLGCSITGGYRYRGGDATLYGKYVFGDFCSGRIWTAAESGGSWSFTEALDTDVMIASFGEDEAGELYMAGYNDGRLYLITDGADSDDDGVSDAIDNCPSNANAGQENADANFIDLSPPKAFDDMTMVNSDDAGNVCDGDDDNDGLSDGAEASHPIAGCASASGATNPLVRDTDGDRVLDGAECLFGTDPASAASKPAWPGGADADNDGAPNTIEAMLGTSSSDSDSDDDGVGDGFEVRYHSSNPLTVDTDGDACADGVEVASINGDLGVSSIDLSQIAQSFGVSGGANYLVNFDVNKDGAITSIDLSLTAQQFGPC